MDKIAQLEKEVSEAEEALWSKRAELKNEKERLRAERREKRYTAEEAAAGRVRLMREIALPFAQAEFDEHPGLKTVVACVAQYWDDEANDAVHCKLACSKNEMPKFEGIEYGDAEWGEKWTGRDYYTSMYRSGKTHKYLEKLWWPDNDEAISLFAAFCKEGCNQEMDLEQAYTPYAVFRKQEDGAITTEVVGKMLRPWLDGVRPEWDE